MFSNLCYANILYSTSAFFAHKQITPQKMLTAHRTDLDRLLTSGATGRLLQISDSTELDYTNKKGAAQLGSLNYLPKISGHGVGLCGGQRGGYHRVVSGSPLRVNALSCAFQT